MFIRSAKGFLYIKVLVFFSLILLIFGLTVPKWMQGINSLFARTAKINLIRELSATLDKLQNDLEFADQLSVKDDQFYYRINNIDYSLGERKNRLARKKNSYTYLTDKKILVNDFSIVTLKKDLYRITFTANISNKVYDFERTIRFKNNE